jgi:predicted regulator of Ras-like GTPase activity (Roadblock/LC7/MglB family)
MSLDDILYEAIDSVRGARFAGIIGTDGLGVRMAYSDDTEDYDLELADLELSALASSAAAASDRIGTGALRDLIVESDALTYMASLLKPGYYAVLGMRSDANVERGRFAVYRMIDRMQQEL